MIIFKLCFKYILKFVVKGYFFNTAKNINGKFFTIFGNNEIYLPIDCFVNKKKTEYIIFDSIFYKGRCIVNMAEPIEKKYLDDI